MQCGGANRIIVFRYQFDQNNTYEDESALKPLHMSALLSFASMHCKLSNHETNFCPDETNSQCTKPISVFTKPILDSRNQLLDWRNEFSNHESNFCIDETNSQFTKPIAVLKTPILRTRNQLSTKPFRGGL